MLSQAYNEVYFLLLLHSVRLVVHLLNFWCGLCFITVKRRTPPLLFIRDILRIVSWMEGFRAYMLENSLSIIHRFIKINKIMDRKPSTQLICDEVPRIHTLLNIKRILHQRFPNVYDAWQRPYLTTALKLKAFSIKYNYKILKTWLRDNWSIVNL